jgi:hypothetical protein
MLIELDILSGLPNPVWTLDTADSGILHELHGALVASRSAPPGVPGLGYRGFCYEVLGNRFRAYRGIVESGLQVLRDPTLSIERFLSDTLPPHLVHLREQLNLTAVMD